MADFRSRRSERQTAAGQGRTVKRKVKLDVSAADVTVNRHRRRSSTPSSAATCPLRCNRSVSRSAERRSAPRAVPRPTQGETFKYHVQRKNKCQAGGSSNATGFPSFCLTSPRDSGWSRSRLDKNPNFLFFPCPSTHHISNCGGTGSFYFNF